MVSVRSLLVTAASLSVAFAQYQGAIVQPESYAVIAPGASFDFSYDGVGDYSVSSYNYSVYLFTEMPTSFLPSGEFANGYFFGRFDYPNYPGKL